MSILSNLLEKAPQSVKDKYKIKIREKAIERVKEKIIKVKLNIEKQIEANDLIAKLQEVENEISSRN